VSTDVIAPIRKETVVRAAPDLAFHVFTAEIGRWWPMATHSVGGEDTVGVSIDGRVGGIVAEATRDGARHVWGTVLLWDPPRRAVFTWHPGHPADDPTELEVVFEPVEGGTRLVLEHRGWERVAWRASRANYQPGWDPVLASFADEVATRVPA
jgi:uncharacterized protein YndB with AHSA1/START domain